MPTYTNVGATAKSLPGFPTGLVEPGSSIGVNRYIPAAALAQSTFELTSHEPRNPPIVKLHDGTIGAGILVASGLAKYKQILILNDSGATISMVFNEDTDNTLKCLAGNPFALDQDHNYDKLVITGAGAGSVYVYGLV